MKKIKLIKRNKNKFKRSIIKLKYNLSNLKNVKKVMTDKVYDIVLKNEIIVKLPKENYRDILQKFLLVYNDDDFEKYKIFDYRIKNQLILN